MFRLCKLSYSTVATALKRFKIKDVVNGEAVSQNGAIQGWVQSIRKHKNFMFVDIVDGTSMNPLQVVLPSHMFNSQLQNGAAVSANGKFVETGLNVNKIEMVCEEIQVIGPCDPDTYPFLKHTPHDMQHLRNYPHLRMRRTSMINAFQLRNQLEMSFHEFFQNKGFTHVHTPIITTSDCEGAGELFSLKSDTSTNPDMENSNSENHFFNKPAYLTVSGQMHLEACAMSLGSVYTLSPVFRAEHGISRKHLSEFRMLEVEVAFTQDLHEILDLIEDSIKFCVERVQSITLKKFDDGYKDIPPQHEKAVKNAKCSNYVRIPYSEALEILQKNSHKLTTAAPVWGDDFNSDQESFLVKHFGLTPVFIINFPKVAKPFYMYANNDNNTVAAVDLIFPFCGEICGGSLREHRLDVLQNSLRQSGLYEKDYEWYLDLRRFGSAPHGGYGLGFDRLVHFLLGTRNIKDAVPFPRTPHSCPL